MRYVNNNLRIILICGRKAVKIVVFLAVYSCGASVISLLTPSIYRNSRPALQYKRETAAQSEFEDGGR
jgi:hypothetical protein